MARVKKTAQEKKRYWLSYDLGLRGNYEALYEWLDSIGSNECGESVATFQSDMTSDQIRQILLDLLGENAKARIYLVSKQTGGKFLIGKRKSAPWAGYSQVAAESVLDQS